RGAARPRAHRARGRPERHSHPDAGAGLIDAGFRAAARVRRDRRDVRAPPRNSSHRHDRRRADAGLRQRLSGRRGGAGDLAGRAHRARHARRHRRKARDRRDRAHRHYPDRARIGPARFPGQRALRSDLSPSLSGRRKTVTRGRPMNEERVAAGMRADVPVLPPGHVWLAGAGPGDPGLLTLDALAGLSQADVVVHDALVDRRVLALAGPQARLEFAGKRGGRPSAEQGDISNRLIELARAGKRVLRLKGGDPCVFGRGGEEALALKAAGVPFRIIPGVTAGLAGLTAAAIPATLRGINPAIILAAGCGAGGGGVVGVAPPRPGRPFVLYMPMQNPPTTPAGLRRGVLPPSTPAAIVVSATMVDERIFVSTLDRVAADAQAHQLGAPSIIVIGAIVNVRERLIDAVQMAESEAAR